MDDMNERDGLDDEQQTPLSPAQGTGRNKLRTIRNVSWAFALIMTVVIAGMAGWKTFGPKSPPTAKQVGQAMIKSKFDLVDHLGNRVTQENYKGRWQLVFFGYTFCPDVCPTTLNTVAQTLDELGEEADKIAPLFITVDPDRDTKEVLAEYVAAFHPKLIGLTGSAEQIKSAAEAFRVYYAKSPQKDAPDGYLVGHSGFIYLMTPDGTYEAVFSHERDTPETIVTAIKKRVQEL